MITDLNKGMRVGLLALVVLGLLGSVIAGAGVVGAQDSDEYQIGYTIEELNSSDGYASYEVDYDASNINNATSVEIEYYSEEMNDSITGTKSDLNGTHSAEMGAGVSDGSNFTVTVSALDANGTVVESTSLTDVVDSEGRYTQSVYAGLESVDDEPEEETTSGYFGGGTSGGVSASLIGLLVMVVVGVVGAAVVVYRD